MVKNRYNSLINGIHKADRFDLSEESVIGNLIVQLEAEVQEVRE
jgi:hypothetical protein